MRKIFHSFHLWLSVPFGLIISAICLSGAALVFENEIMELCYSERYKVENVGENPLPVDQLLEKVVRTLPDSVSITGVTIFSDPEKMYQISLSKPRRASVAIDQYTGEVKGRNERTGFFIFMFRMHRWLLDSVKSGEISVGKTVVGISTLLFVFILISGIVIWIPRNRKALKHRLSITFTKGLRRFWYDLHVVGGIYAMAFLLVLALTGLTWSFSWYRTAFYKVFGVEVVQQLSHGTKQAATEHTHSTKTSLASGKDSHGHRSKNRYVCWQQVYEQLNRENPDNRQINVSNGSATVAFYSIGNQRATDKYTFNPINGEIIDANFYKDRNKSEKIRGWIYSVHVGNWGGWFTQVLTFMAALLGGTLPLTGYYLWIKKTINKRQKSRAHN